MPIKLNSYTGEEPLKDLTKAPYHGKVEGDSIVNINCPSCGEPKAQTLISAPTSLQCKSPKNCNTPILLSSASTPQEYGEELWREAKEPTEFCRIFDFRNSMHICLIERGSLAVKQIADASISVEFVQISRAGNHSLTLIVDTNQRFYHVIIDVTDLLSPKFSEEIAKKTRAWVTRNHVFLQQFYKYLNYGKHPEIRETGTYGLDKGCRSRKGADWYVFHGYAFDPEGNLIPLEEKKQSFKIWPNEYIRGEQHFKAAIKKNSCKEELPLAEFIKDIHTAFGGRGLLALGFWISSLFQGPVRKAFGFFPFLSMFGDPAAGKSTLSIILNRALSFADWEGIPMSRTNTLKGPQRIIASQSSVAVPLLEWNNKSKISEEDLLNLYGGNPQQVKADNSPDGAYIEVPFNCSLVIVTNTEPFTLRQVKERIISLHFFKDDLTKESSQAAKKLMDAKPEELLTVGIQLLRQRRHYQEKVVSEIKCKVDDLSKSIDDRRIVENHSIPMGGLVMLLSKLQNEGHLSLEEKGKYMEDAYDICFKSAEDKIISAQTEFVYADSIIEKLTEIANKDTGSNNSFVKWSDGILCIRMTDALDQLEYPKYLHKSVKDELKTHPLYKDNTRSLRIFNSKKTKVWEFHQQLE